jgi:protein-S-isoprenylcysteine O-methyltransferase Ste14
VLHGANSVSTVSTSTVGWAWVALVLYLLGLVLAFGVRTWMQLRRTGTSGFRGISGRRGSLAWWGGALFPAALLLGLVAPVGVITGVTATLAWLAHPAVATTGLVLGIVGVAVVLRAQSAMGTSWRIGVDDSERTELVTDGLFGRARNPIFTGMAAVAAGVALVAPTPVSALAVVCLVAAVQIQVRVVEEPYLVRTHGQRYLHYAASAGRFLPAIGRIRGERGPRDTTTSKPAGRSRRTR